MSVEGVTAAEAAFILSRARDELSWYNRALEEGELDVESCQTLAKHAWVRAIVFEQLNAEEEVEERKGDVALELQQYLGAVYALQGLLNLEPIDFGKTLAGAIKVDLTSIVDAGAVTVGGLVTEVGCDVAASHLRVTSACAVYDTTVVSTAGGLLLDERVRYLPVYPREFVEEVSLSVSSVGAVRLAFDDVTGVGYVDREGVAYDVDDLPSVHYKMRRGARAVVAKREFVRALNNLILVPSLMKRSGYCYLLAVPPAMRQDMASMLGPNPFVNDLRRLLPNAGQWCTVNCKYKTTSRGYHVLSTGALPNMMDSYSRVGVAPVDDVVENELRAALARIDGRRRLSDASQRQGRATMMPQRLMSNASRLTMSVESRPSRGVGFTGVDVVTLLPTPAELLGVSTKHNRRDEDLIRRLDQGGPISDSYLRKASNRFSVGRYMPAVRTEVGRVVLLPDGMIGCTATTGEWKIVDLVVGWRTSRLSFRNNRGDATHSFVVAPTAAARLDCSVAGDIAVGGLKVPGQATVIWFQGGVQFTVRGSGGSVAASVPVSGAATGPGWLAATAVAMFGCPYVKVLVTEHQTTPELLVLKDGATSKYGLTRTSGAVNVRGVGLVDISVSSDVGRLGTGVFCFGGRGLRSVIVGGVVVPAIRGEARVIVDGWATAFKLDMASPGKVKVVASLVSDAGALENNLRSSPDTPNMPQCAF